jgi:hypothetical protein
VVPLGSAGQITLRVCCISVKTPDAVITRVIMPIAAGRKPEEFRAALLIAVSSKSALLLTHQAGKFAGDCTSGSIFAERKPCDRHDDKQNWANGGDRVEGDGSPRVRALSSIKAKTLSIMILSIRLPFPSRTGCPITSCYATVSTRGRFVMRDER